MSHISPEKLSDYITNLLNQKEQQAIELHIHSCDVCLSEYLDVIENQTLDVSLSESFTDVTMDKMNHHKQRKEKIQRSSKLPINKTLTHYVIAAGLTLLLMLTGVFQGFLDMTNSTKIEEHQSFTTQFMNNKNDILDYMEGDEKQ
ncbi:hypothetical protein [Aquibacillus rhizosphaerae]|uniref:Zinc-finger domain-containing protein n=1 Tax=Aquibacillus rhizosphaerae TaxID=3051431 RepID=A0ABT7L8S9_9BACI|nr:hypothetical protein [Aquibacillus sp. LR5S19]MDL4842274.1 hypothetical protein [Aquibacillus sp. LR5S19]